MKELTDKEFNWLKKLDKETYKAWDDLTDWERKFMEDLLERFRTYGKRLLISKYQWEKIGQISEKIIAYGFGMAGPGTAWRGEAWRG